MMTVQGATSSIACSKCNTHLPPSLMNATDYLPCPNCGRRVQTVVFPALFRPPELGRVGELVTTVGEASCFQHADRRAVISCESCGRFLCSLCDIHLGEKHLCSACIETGRRKGKLKDLEHERTLYPRLALLMVAIGLITGPLAAIFGLVAVAVALWGWRKPRSLVKPGNLRFATAIIIGCLEIAGGSVLWYFILEGSF